MRSSAALEGHRLLCPPSRGASQGLQTHKAETSGREDKAGRSEEALPPAPAPHPAWKAPLPGWGALLPSPPHAPPLSERSRDPH